MMELTQRNNGTYKDNFSSGHQEGGDDDNNNERSLSLSPAAGSTSRRTSTTGITMNNEEDVKLLESNSYDDTASTTLTNFDDEHEDEDDDHHHKDQANLSIDSSKPWNLQDWLYPPHIPRECQLLRIENLAIPACYLLVGLLQGLMGPLVNVYPLDLGATEAQYTVMANIRGLPSSFKLIFGFISDNYPLGGYRRKSYMLVGWLIAAFSMCFLLVTTDLTLSEQQIQVPISAIEGMEEEDGSNYSTFHNHTQQLLRLRSRRSTSTTMAMMGTNSTADDGTNTTSPTMMMMTTKTIMIAPDNAPSIPLLSLMILLFGIGFWMADVMGDSVVAEKAKLEPPHSRGNIQSSCYAYRFFGLMCAAPFSTAIYHYLGPYYVFLILALLPLSIIPLIYQLEEIQHAPIASTKEQCYEIWNTVCSRSVWQPLGFVFIYNLFQVQNSAWKEYLKTVLEFSTGQLNLIYVASVVLLYLGVICYKYGMMKWSWRMVYIITTILNGFFSLLQVLLIWGITFGISKFWFALGDDAFSEFIQGIQFLPTTIMMVHLCPSGSEGASYAMFTTVHNAALMLNVAVSTWVLSFWDVSKPTLEVGDVSGMINLTYLTTALQVFPILFVCLLPQTKEHLMELKHQTLGTSSIGGTIFLIVTISSVVFAIIGGVLNIIAPGWMGES